MKIIYISLLVFTVALIFVFLVLAMMSRNEDHVYLSDQKLLPCSKRNNCVCSEYEKDKQHYIPALKLTGVMIDILPPLKNIIVDMGGTIQLESRHYLAATFTSKIFSFVDDLEIRLDIEKNLLQMRSSSRVGYSDGGINKKRIQQIKKRVQQLLMDKK